MENSFLTNDEKVLIWLEIFIYFYEDPILDSELFLILFLNDVS